MRGAGSIKWAGWSVAALALSLCDFLGWRVLDDARVVERLGEVANRAGMRSVMVLDVVRDAWIGRPEADFADFARLKKEQGWLVNRHDDVVQLDELVFRISERRVASVDFIP